MRSTVELDAANDNHEERIKLEHYVSIYEEKDYGFDEEYHSEVGFRNDNG